MKKRSRYVRVGDEFARVLHAGNVVHIRRGVVTSIAKDPQKVRVRIYNGHGQWSSDTFWRKTIRKVFVRPRGIVIS